MSTIEILPVMTKPLRTGRSSSIDVRFVSQDNLESQGGQRPLQQAFEKLSRRNKSISAGAGHPLASPKYEKQELVWRDVDTSPKTGRWRTRKTLVYSGLAATLLYFGWSAGTSTTGSDLLKFGGSSGAVCNPFATSGRLHVDYAEPSNNYWQTNDARCPAPRYVSKLRSGDLSGLEWMRGRTMFLIGDSIERDHVSLFASMMGQEVEVIKGHHPLALTTETIEPSKAEQLKKKDRYGRIALKGMQESTLPRYLHLEELDFVMISMYHFGLDQDDFWRDLDQYHAPGSIEDRFAEQYLPLEQKLRSLGRSVDMVEIGTGMYDLARWAKEDVGNSKATDDPLTSDRLQWYQERLQKFTSLVSDAFPSAIKTYRGVTVADDQAAELDYFNDRFGHSPPSVTAYFAPNRAKQIAAEAHKLLKPYSPKASPRVSHDLTKRGSVQGADVHLNPWTELVKDVPAHQLDRLHGGDLATPGAALWADIALWHLQQGLKQKSA